MTFPSSLMRMALAAAFCFHCEILVSAEEPEPQFIPPELKTLVDAFEQTEAAVQQEIRPQFDAARSECEAAIQASADNLLVRKKIEEAKSLMSELKRFQKLGLSAGLSRSAPPDARSAVAKFAKQVQTAKASIALKLRSARTKYAQDLATLERTFSTKGQASDAAAVRRARVCLAIRIAVDKGAVATSGLAGKKKESLWEDVPAEGAYLAGFKVKKGGWFQFEVAKGVTPVFQTALGLRDGEGRGSPGDEFVSIAKDGYAVGGINFRAGEVLDAMQVVFMKIAPNGVSLDARESYTGEWMGGEPPKSRPGQINTHGNLAVGLTGQNTDTVESLAFIHLK